MRTAKTPTCTRCDHVLADCTCKADTALLLCNAPGCNAWAPAVLEHRIVGAVAVPYQKYTCPASHIEYIRYSRTDYNEEENNGRETAPG